MADLSQEHIDEISNALAKGSKIEAIKIYREVSGLGLKEAKEFIDELIPKLTEQDPERFAKLAPSGTGCSTAVIVIIAVSLAAFGTAGALTALLFIA